jgi:hypothetical protein
MKTELENESLIPTYEHSDLVMYAKDTSLDNEEFNDKVEAWLLYHNILDVILAIELAKQHWLILFIRFMTVLMYIVAWCVYLHKPVPKNLMVCMLLTIPKLLKKVQIVYISL